MKLPRKLQLVTAFSLAALLPNVGCSSIEHKQTTYTTNEVTTPSDAWATFKAELKKVLPRKAEAPKGCPIDMTKPYRKEEVPVSMQNYYQHKNNDPNVIVAMIIGKDKYGRPVRCGMTNEQVRAATGCFYGIGCN